MPLNVGLAKCFTVFTARRRILPRESLGNESRGARSIVMLPLLESQEKKVSRGASSLIMASPLRSTRDAPRYDNSLALRATKPFGQVLARVRASEIESGSARASGRKVFGVAGSRRIILPGGSGPATRYAVRRHLSLEAQSRRVGTRQERGSGALVHSQDAVSRHGPRARRACVPPRRARRCPGKSRSSPVPVGRHHAIAAAALTVHRRRPNALDLPVYGGCSSLDSGTAAPGRRHAADCDACLSLSAPVGQASSCASEGPVPSLIRRGVCAGRSSYGRLSRDLSA